MSALGWILLAVFLLLLIGGIGVVIWAVAQPRADRGGRAAVLGVASSAALAGLIGAVVVAASMPGTGGGVGRMMGGGMMSGGTGSMMGSSASGPCPGGSAEPSTPAIEGFRFCPSTIRVRVGTTVTWTNEDNVPHTVTSTSGPRFDSGNLAQGRSWSHRFETEGTSSYYCAVHPWMRGTVEVTT